MNNQIQVLYNSEVVGVFSKLTLCFYKDDIKDLLDNTDKVQLVFVLEKGLLEGKPIAKIVNNNADKDIKFTIKFTLENKDYFINRSAFASLNEVILKEDYTGTKFLYKKIEGVGELINFKELPTTLIDNNILVITNN